MTYIQGSLENIPKEIIHIAEKIAHISGTWNPVEIYTADSDTLEKEKDIFLHNFDRNNEYNPIFTYRFALQLDLKKHKKDLEKYLVLLNKYSEKEIGIRKTKSALLFTTALFCKIKDDLATIELAEGLKTKDETRIAHALSEKYPGTDSTLIHLANQEFEEMVIHGEEKQILLTTNLRGVISKEELTWLLNTKLSSAQVAEAFKWALKQYGILRTARTGRGFYVAVSKETTDIDVRDKSEMGPTIFIPEKSNPSIKRLLELMAHEIEGHARQSVNGEELMFLGGGRLKIDNEQLYEGLGLRYEHRIKEKLFGLKNQAPLPYYVFATKMAEDGSSFYQIFNDQLQRRIRVALKLPMGHPVPALSAFDSLKQWHLKKNSWRTTYRVMRGHIDTSNKSKFAMAKDLGYLRGYQMDKQLVDNELGHLNEIGVIASEAIAMLAELKMKPDELPLPFRDVTTKYYEEVIRHQIPYDIRSEPLPPTA